MRGADRITTYVPRELARDLDRFVLEHGLAKSRVIAEALREYIGLRRERPSTPLGARLPRREGRPSQVDLDDARQREAALRKTSGRPIRPRIAPADTIVNSTSAVRTTEASDAA
jgi:hypothetical protein